MTGQSADTLRVMHYNLLAFGLSCPGVNVLDKYNWLGNILDYYEPDIFTVNEIGPSVLLANGIRDVSFDYSNRIAYAPLTNEAGADRVNMLFYNQTKLGYLSNTVVGGGIRDINAYKLYHKPVRSDTVFLYCIVAHFKAGDGANDVALRSTDASRIMNWIAARGIDNNILVMGDMNLSGASEQAFQTMVFNSDPDLRLTDPAGKQNGWDGPTHAKVHTQSTRQSSPDCGSGGGMDDRFDLILGSPAILSGEKHLAFVPGTYQALGNGGNSYDGELNCAGSTVPTAVCIDLKRMSDHLPVVMSLAVSAGSDRLGSGIPGFALHHTVVQDQHRLSLRPGSAVFPLSLEIHDLSGRQLVQTRLDDPSACHLSLDGLSAGMYVLRVQDARGRRFTQPLAF
ncbi:MAG: hypothetical protein OHK0039_11750 [Bacteroidia bacterium]